MKSEVGQDHDILKQINTVCKSNVSNGQRSAHKPKEKTVPQDTGYSWFVMLGCFLTTFISIGFSVRASGIIILRIRQDFNTSAADTAWIPAVLIGVSNAVGPLAPIVVHKLGTRFVMFLGAVFSFIGWTSSYFVDSVYYFYITIGFFPGVALTCSFMPAINHVTLYFTAKRAIAIGLGMAGTGIGGFISAQVVTLSLEEYGLKGTFLIMAAISLNLAVAGMFFRPVSFYGVRMPEAKSGTCSAFGLIVRDPKFWVFCVVKFTLLCGYFGMMVIIIPSVSADMGFSAGEVGIIVGVFAGSDALGRIGVGVINDVNVLSTNHLTLACFFLTGLITCIIPTVASSLVTMLVLVIPCGVFSGAIFPLHNVLLYQMMAPELASNAFGLSLLAALPQAFLQASFGMIYDSTGSWIISIYLCGAVFFIGGLAVGCLDIMARRKKNKEHDSIMTTIVETTRF